MFHGLWAKVYMMRLNENLAEDSLEAATDAVNRQLHLPFTHMDDELDDGYSTLDRLREVHVPENIISDMISASVCGLIAKRLDKHQITKADIEHLQLDGIQGELPESLKDRQTNQRASKQACKQAIKQVTKQPSE